MDLDANPFGRVRLEALAVTVVAAEYAGHRHIELEKWPKRKRGAVIARVQHHAAAVIDHPLEQLTNGRHAIVCIRHQPDKHQSTLHSGSSTSCLTRCS